MLFKDIDIIDENYNVQKGMNIIVEEDKIIYIGQDMPKDYKGEIFHGENKLATPGFFNTHCHIPMTLLRGYGEGLPLHKWLFEKMFPFEAKLTPDDIYWGSMLGAMELIKSGVVSFTEMYFHIEDIYRAVNDSGLKANISHGTSNMDENVSFKDLKAYKDTDRLHKMTKNNPDGRVKVDIGLHAEYTSTEKLVYEVADYAKRNDLIVHTHISETKKEHEECKERYGMTTVAFFEKAGLLDQPVVGAHCVWVEDEDIGILRDKGVSVAHNISSNLKLGSGFAPVKQMLEEGINVTIGTDGASSNNNLNMLEEVHLVAMVNKGSTLDPEFMNSKEAFKLATYNGAISQGREDCGRIKVGNKADIVIYDMDKPHLQPAHDPLSNIVFSSQANDICLSMIDGEIVYKNGEVTFIDSERVIYEANRIVRRILAEI